MEELRLLARYVLAPIAAGALALALLAGCVAAGEAEGSAAGSSTSTAAAFDEGSAAVTQDEASVQAEASMDDGEDGESGEAMGEVTATLNGTEVTIELADTEAARVFAELLPLDATLSNLHGNEKYVYLDAMLPSAASNPGRVEAGDIMLFGSDCLVIFYESFDTPYSYTRIGRVSDPDALEAIAAASSVTASFTR